MASAVPAAPSGRRSPFVVFVALVALAALPIGAPLPLAAAGVPVAADAYERSVSNGWGADDTGGAYALEGNPASFSVGAGSGSIVLPNSNSNRAATLSGVSARDVDATIRLGANKRPTGGSLFVYLPVRRSGPNAYRPKAILHPNGTVSVHAGIVINNTESSLGAAVVVGGLTHAANTFIRLRAQVSGANPTTISVRAWADGAPEPATWQFVAVNSAAEVQQPGAVGVRAYLHGGATNAPLIVSVDDLLVESHDAPPPPPAPGASFEWAQTAGSLDVSFSDQSSGAPTEWLWDFGDSGSSAEQSPTHSYAATGAYSVTLTATNEVGTDTIVRQVDVVEPPPPPTILAADSFERAASGTWEVADPGGLYSYQGNPVDFATTGSEGTLRLPNAGATRSAFLFSTLAQDVTVSFAVSTSKPASGGSMFIYASLRRTTSGLAYRPKVRVAADGSVFAHAGRLGASGETSLGPEVRVPGLSHVAGQRIQVRAEAIGSNPTTVRIRAWADGQPEPVGWHFTALDANAALQGPGAVGLLSHLHAAASNAPVVVHFDDLRVTTTAPIDRVQGETFVGAGDISVCNGTGDESTARLLDLISGTVFAAGDTAYPNGSAIDFANCYEPTWGRHLARTRPAVGNHEYQTPGAAAYYAYFGAAAGDPAEGYYAFDLGEWRVIVLNTNCAIVSCLAGSPQEQWLRAELAAGTAQCQVAVGHHPRFSSGNEHGSNATVQPLWQALHDAGAELLLSGHEHNYERLAPMNAVGEPDAAAGVRQFVVGTGGVGLRAGFSPVATSEVRQASSHGVLQLTLGSGAYEWEFIPIAGQTFTDRGSGSCH